MKFIISCLAFFFFISLNAQNTYSVDNKPGAAADFSNLQDAIDAVPAGSTLLVQGSNINYGTVTADKEIHIIGPGYFLNENPNTQEYGFSVDAYIYLIQGADNSSIQGINNSSTVFRIDDCSNVTIKHCRGRDYVISNSNNLAVLNSFLFGGSGASHNGTISNNSSNILFSGNFMQSTPNFSIASPSAVTLHNNVFGNNSKASLIYFLSYYEVSNNIIIRSDALSNSYNLNNYPNFKNNVCVGTHNLVFEENDNDNIFGVDANSIFIDTNNSAYSQDGQYILQAGSPAIGIGIGGNDAGMFGGGYRLSGIPNIPNIYEFTVPDTGYTNDGGIPVTIKVKANN